MISPQVYYQSVFRCFYSRKAAGIRVQRPACDMCQLDEITTLYRSLSPAITNPAIRGDYQVTITGDEAMEMGPKQSFVAIFGRQIALE